MNSDRDLPCGRGCPIRRSRDHRSLASPPGFSQRATSFIASQCQGIHQMPFSALDPGVSDCGGSKLPRETPSTPPRTGAKPCSPQTCPREAGNGGQALAKLVPAKAESGGPCIWRPHMKTLLRARARLSAARRARLGHMTNSLFTLQTTSRPVSRTMSLRTSPNVADPPPPRLTAAVAEVPDGGGERIRTDDLLLAKQALSQLSYTPFQKTVINDQ